MIAAPKELGQLPKVDSQNVRLLWYCDYWDGPVNGLCIYNNEKCWFEACFEGDQGFPEVGPRKYVVFRLSPVQLADEEKWHELFRSKVGTHCDFDEPHPQVKPEESHRDFYEAFRERGKVDYSTNRPLAWFELA